MLLFYLDCENEPWVTTLSHIFDVWFLETDQCASIITGFPQVQHRADLPHRCYVVPHVRRQRHQSIQLICTKCLSSKSHLCPLKHENLFHCIFFLMQWQGQHWRASSWLNKKWRWEVGISGGQSAAERSQLNGGKNCRSRSKLLRKEKKPWNFSERVCFQPCPAGPRLIITSHLTGSLQLRPWRPNGDLHVHDQDVAADFVLALSTRFVPVTVPCDGITLQNCAQKHP